MQTFAVGDVVYDAGDATVKRLPRFAEVIEVVTHPFNKDRVGGYFLRDIETGEEYRPRYYYGRITSLRDGLAHMRARKTNALKRAKACEELAERIQAVIDKIESTLNR